MTLAPQDIISQTLSHLKRLAPGGYALAFHIRFTAPSFLFQTYTKEWSEQYSRDGLVMRDPTVRWGMSHTGWQRWSDLADPEDEVITQAARHGLRNGVTYATAEGDSRSFGSFANPERPFHEDEITEICRHIDVLHRETAKTQVLDPATKMALKRLSIQYIDASGAPE